MNILITGCKGQLGTEIIKIAKTDKNHTWFFTDVDRLDICDAQAVEDYFSSNEIQVCINFAASPASPDPKSDDAVGVFASPHLHLFSLCSIYNRLMNVM